MIYQARRSDRLRPKAGIQSTCLTGTQSRRSFRPPLSSDIRFTKTAATLRTSITGEGRISTPFALRVAQYCKPCEAMACQFSEEVFVAPRAPHPLGKSSEHHEQRNYYCRHPRVRHSGGMFQIDLLERDYHKNRDSCPFDSVAGSDLTLKMFTYRHVFRHPIWPVHILLLATAGVERMTGAGNEFGRAFLRKPRGEVL